MFKLHTLYLHVGDIWDCTMQHRLRWIPLTHVGPRSGSKRLAFFPKYRRQFKLIHQNWHYKNKLARFFCPNFPNFLTKGVFFSAYFRLFLTNFLPLWDQGKSGEKIDWYIRDRGYAFIQVIKTSQKWWKREQSQCHELTSRIHPEYAS